LDVLCVERLDGAATAFIADVYSAASLKYLATADGDRVCTDGARCHDGNALPAGDTIDRGLNRGTVVGARVQLGSAARGNEATA
jgi:hypothetical protein